MLWPLGPFTNDVSREGEGGGWPISDERKRGCVNLVLTRGEGVQNPKNLADVICERPLKWIIKLNNFTTLYSDHKDLFSCNVHKECSFIPIESLFLDFLDKAHIISMMSFDYGCIKHISSLIEVTALSCISSLPAGPSRRRCMCARGGASQTRQPILSLFLLLMISRFLRVKDGWQKEIAGWAGQNHLSSVKMISQK